MESKKFDNVNKLIEHIYESIHYHYTNNTKQGFGRPTSKTKQIFLNKYNKQLSKLSFNSVVKFDSKTKAMFLSYEDDVYFVCTNIISNLEGNPIFYKVNSSDYDEFIPELIDFKDIIFLSIINNLEIDPVDDVFKIYDKILYEDDQPISIDSLHSIYDDIYISKIDNDNLCFISNNQFDLYKIITYHSINSGNFNLNINPYAKDKLILLLSEDYPINFYSLLTGILSTHWSQFYLSVYKIIESMYPYFFYEELIKKTVNTSFDSVRDLALFIESNLSGAKPKEELSFKKLIDCIDPKEEFSPCKLRDLLADKSHSSTAYYKLRNNIVHEREIFNRGKHSINYEGFSDSDWNEIINELINIVIEGFSYIQNNITKLN